MERSKLKSLVGWLVRRMSMAKEDASKVADEIKNVFQDQDEVEDSILSKDCRIIFYTLQDEGLMSVRRLEVKQKGTSIPLRHYYWSLKEPERAQRKEREDPYEDIPAEVWSRRSKE